MRQKRTRTFPALALRANGCPAFAAYKPDPESSAWQPWSLTVLELEAGRGGAAVRGVHNFLAPFLPELFGSFGLPARRDQADATVASAPSP